MSEGGEDAFGKNDTARGDLIVIILFFGSIILFCGLTVGFFVYRYRTMEAELRMQELILVRRECEALSRSFDEQLRLIPIPLLHPFSIYASHRAHHYLSLFFFFCTLSGLIVVCVGLALPSENETDIIRAKVLLYGTLVFVMAMNLYAITRHHLFRLLPRPPIFSSAAYKPRDYETFERGSWYNRVQIIVLVLESLQLLSFPLRDLVDNTRLVKGEPHTQSTMDSVVNAISLLPDLSSIYYYIHFWTCMAAVAVSLLAAVGCILYNNRSRTPISVHWVSYLVPIVMLLYLPILVTFISSVACLAKGSTELARGARQCPGDVESQRVLYTLLSLLAYTGGYFLLTLFVSSYDRLPRPGDMNFKSTGVVFMKNAGLFLVIDFLLIPESEVRARGVLSILILLAVVCYNVANKPCYVDSVNYWRIATMSAILWTALLVPILDDQSIGLDLGFGATIALAFGGMGGIIIIFTLIRHFYRHEIPEEVEEKAELLREEEERERRAKVERMQKIGLLLERQGYSIGNDSTILSTCNTVTDTLTTTTTQPSFLPSFHDGRALVFPGSSHQRPRAYFDQPSLMGSHRSRGTRNTRSTSMYTTASDLNGAGLPPSRSFTSIGTDRRAEGARPQDLRQMERRRSDIEIQRHSEGPEDRV